jgi:hypothetical protein
MFFGIRGTFSVDVLGVLVERLSMELLGRLLVEELADVRLVKFISTLCGRCRIFCRVVAARAIGFSFSDVGDGSFVTFPRGTDKATVPIFGSRVVLFSVSFSFLLLRFEGEGDLEEEIHDFRAKVANDSDTDLALLSRIVLEIVGTGGASTGVVWIDSEEFCRSGEPFRF